MYKQSNEAKLAYQSAERTLDIVVNVNGVDYKATDIEQFDYDSGGYTGDTFSIGSTYENNITVKFIHLVEGLKRGMIVKPRIGIKLPNGTFEYTPLGVFIIADEIQMDRNNNSTTIKAYDKFVVMEGQYVSKLTYPANAVDIITEIAQMCKVDINTDDLAHLPTIKVSKAITKQSYRTAIGWIAQLYVGFASFDRDGKLTIRRVAEPNYTIEPSEYEQQGLVKNEAPYIIGGISCNVNVVETTNNGETNETTHKLHSGSVNGSQIELTNDIMTQSLLDSIWDSLKSITFYPFSLNWFGNPAIEAGDWLSLKDMKGNVFVVPNNGYTISFNGGLSSTSKADQNATDSSTVKYTGELTRAIENYSRRQAPDGTNIYTDVKEPTDAKFNDVWFKPNGNSTELWIFERQVDGSGKWVKQPVNGEVEQKINDALKEFDELDKSFKDNANAQSSTNELMKSRIDSISNQIPNLSDEISRVNGNVTSLKTQTDKDRQQLQTTSQNLDKTRQDLLSNNNKIDKLTTQTDKDRQQLQTTSQNLDKARQDVLSNSNRIDKLSVGLDSVNINVNNVNSKVDNMQVGGTNLIPHSEVDTIRGNTDYWVFSTGNINNYGGRYNPTDKSLELEVHIKDTNYQFLQWQQQNNVLMNTELAHLQVGDVLTVSAEVYIQNPNMSGNITLGFRVNPRTNYNSYFSTERGIDLRNLKTGWQRVSATGTITQKYLDCINDVQLIRILLAANGLKENNKIAFRKIKAEKGTIATDWSPAPEDEIERVSQLRVDLNGMNATVATNKGDIAQIKLTENGMQQSIKDAQGNISVLQNDSKQFKQQFQDVNGNIATITNTANSLSSQLSTKVGTSEYNSFKNQTAQELRTKLIASDLNGYAKSADVKVSVDGLNARFDNLNVGGTNLLRKTSNEWKTWTGTGWANNTVDAGAINLDAGTYTFRVEIDNTGNTQRGVHVEAWVNSESKFMDGIAKSYTQTFVNAGSKGYATTTFTIDRPLTDVRIHPHTAVNSAIPSTVTIKWRKEKLEKGTVPTDWSPAPEDMIERVSQLRVDLNGMSATVATNKGDIAQIKLTENGMQQSIKDAQGNISVLQNDSKQFKQQFQDVNGNIATITNTANSLSSQLSTKVGTSEYNSFKNQTAQELRTKLIASDLNGYAKSADVKVSVDGLNARFDNLNVGGTNLLRKTSNEWKTWTGTGWANNTVDAGAINLDAGTYTFRVEIDNTGNTQRGVHVEAWVNSESKFMDGIAKSYTQTFVNAGSKGYATTTFTIDRPLTDVRIHPHTAVNSAIPSTVTIKWRKEKLEKGTVPTDWSPAPEDVTDKIEVLSGKITANSNEFSTVYSKITNVQNVVNSDGGGINLAKHTSNKLSNVTASPWLFVGSPSSSSFNNLQDYQGKYMTVRVWIEKPSRDARVRIWTDKWAIEGNVIKAGQSGYSTASGIIPTGFSAWNIPVGRNDSGSVTFGWKEFKIELGNVATPWSPNPDDVDNNIDTAANNARTNAKNDAVNAIKSDSQWQSMGKIVTNASFLQNSDGFAQEVSKRIVGSTGQTNLYYNSEFTYTGTDPHNMDGIQSTRNVAYSRNDRWSSYKGSNAVFASTRATLNDYYYIEHRKDKYVKVQPGEVVSASVVTWVTGGSDVPRDGYALCTISFYKDLSSSRMGYKETSVAAKDINYPYYRTLKVENVTVPDGANYMILHLIIRGSSNWQFSQPMLVKDDHVGVYVPSTQLQLNQVIDTADSHTRTITDYLTGSNSRFVQMANYFNMNVGNSSVSVNGNGVMLSGNRIKITGKTLIDNAVILDALIKDINANTIKTKTLDASKINVTNLNANNITSGTLSGANFGLNLDKGNMKIGVADKSKSIVLDNGKIDLYSSDVLSTTDYVGTITTVKGGPANHAIRIAGNDGFLIGTEDFTNNFFADGGYPWGTDPKNYVSGSGIFGYKQNMTIATGPTRDHSTLAMVAGAIPSDNLGNMFGSRAQPGMYIYGRDNAHKDLSFATIAAPLAAAFNTRYGSIGVGNRLIFSGLDTTDTSLDYGKISLTLNAPNKKNPGISIVPSSINLGIDPDGIIPDNPYFSMRLNENRVFLSASKISITADEELYLQGKPVSINGDLSVIGSKNAIVPSSKGYIAINAYETAEYYFGDIGESQTDKQGVKIINLDPLFLETVNTSVPYQVFLSSYDDAKVWVFARNNNMFIVKSDKPNVKFAWEIKAKRKDYENVRLKTVNYKGERN